MRLVQRYQNNKPEYVPGDSIACANLANDIFLYSFDKGYILNQFYAHDDYIIGLLFAETKLISYSLDQTIKIWPLKHEVVNMKKQYEDNPITLFDHEAQILTADVLKSSSWKKGELNYLASLDVEGTIFIHDVKGE